MTLVGGDGARHGEVLDGGAVDVVKGSHTRIVGCQSAVMVWPLPRKVPLKERSETPTPLVIMMSASSCTNSPL